jgi:hypothetical protein
MAKCENCGGNLHFSFTKQGWFHTNKLNHESCKRVEPQERR